MPVRKVQRFTESDLRAIVARGNRSQNPAKPDAPRNTTQTLDAGNAPGVSSEAAGSSPVATSGGDDASAQGAFVMLDYPVSANRYWRNFKGRTVISAEARTYKSTVFLLWKSMGLPLHTGPVCVSILLHPRLTNKGEESRSRIDLDNCIKVAIDALNGVAFADDKQVRRLLAEIADPVEGGALSVKVTA